MYFIADPNITTISEDLPTEFDSGQVTIRIPGHSDARLNERFNKVVIVVSEVHDANRNRRSLMALMVDCRNTYKVAEFPLLDSNETFNIGDGQQYGRYENRYLEVGSYHFYVGYQAVTEVDVDEYYRITSQPITGQWP